MYIYQIWNMWVSSFLGGYLDILIELYDKANIW